MQQESPEHSDQGPIPWLDINIPPVVRATPEEIARRQQLIARARHIRAEIGPINISATELIRQARDEGDAE